MALSLHPVSPDALDIPPVPPDPVDAYRRRARALGGTLYCAALAGTPRHGLQDDALQAMLIWLADDAAPIAPAWANRLRDLAALVDTMSTRLDRQPIPGDRLIQIARGIIDAANQPWDAGTLPPAGGAA